MTRGRQAGQSIVEYTVAVSLIALALTVGPASPLEQLFDAFHARFQRFTYALSRP